MSFSTKKTKGQLLIALSAIAVLLARAFQHLIKGSPYSTIFYNEHYLGQAHAKLRGVSFYELLQQPSYHNIFREITIAFGVLYFVTALLILIAYWQRKMNWFTIIACVLSSLGLMFLSVNNYINKGENIFIFLEYAMQFCAPLFFIFMFLRKKFSIFIIKGSIAITFIAHGCFALNIFQTPPHFVNMFLSCTPFNQEHTILMLKLVGFLDIVCSILIFTNYYKLLKFSLYYLIVWGFLTAFARIACTISIETFTYNLVNTVPKFVVRAVHFLLPMFLLVTNEKSKKS